MNVRPIRPVLLCIDDEDTALQLSIRKRVLETAGYRVLTTTSAHEALEIFRENHVDLVLTERVQSLTLAAMKTLKPEVPIAIYSANWAESPEEMRFADVFITKLVSVNALLGIIERLLAEGPTATAA